MSSFSATSSQEGFFFTANGIQVSATASATATSTISQQDAQNIADAIAKQNAASEAEFSASLLDQGVIVDNLQEYDPIVEGYVLYSELLPTQKNMKPLLGPGYTEKSPDYTITTYYATLYDSITNKPIGRWGSFKNTSINGVGSNNVFSTQQYYIVMDETNTTYSCTRLQNTEYATIGCTDIQLVTSHFNTGMTPDTRTYIPYIWKTYRPDATRLNFTILKSATNSA
uniref:Uncharacterized protein n=1 Tax=viral metagenome TaxID=1070528 RepID=A0A6C0B9L2_9ZZZZ